MFSDVVEMLETAEEEDKVDSGRPVLAVTFTNVVVAFSAKENVIIN